MAERFCKGDSVIVISGRDKGKVGKILKILSDENKVIVEGTILNKRHIRPTAHSPKGGVVHQETPIHACKIMLLDPETKKGTRIRFRVNTEGKKRRIAVKSGAEIVAGLEIS